MYFSQSFRFLSLHSLSQSFKPSSLFQPWLPPCLWQVEYKHHLRFLGRTSSPDTTTLTPKVPALMAGLDKMSCCVMFPPMFYFISWDFSICSLQSLNVREKNMIFTCVLIPINFFIPSKSWDASYKVVASSPQVKVGSSHLCSPSKGFGKNIVAKQCWVVI